MFVIELIVFLQLNSYNYYKILFVNRDTLSIQKAKIQLLCIQIIQTENTNIYIKQSNANYNKFIHIIFI